MSQYTPPPAEFLSERDRARAEKHLPGSLRASYYVADREHGWLPLVQCMDARDHDACYRRAVWGRTVPPDINDRHVEHLCAHGRAVAAESKPVPREWLPLALVGSVSLDSQEVAESDA